VAPLSPAKPTTAPSEPTHPCVRCGAPVPLADAMCDRCNPLGLPQPASSQAHGTIFLGIGLAVVGLAVLGKLALAGIGPMVGNLASVTSDPPGLSVTISVTNRGSRAGYATCHVFDTSAGIGPDTPTIETPRIDPGATVNVSQRITEYGSQVRPLVVECSAP
jgi:hypothetical protein